MEARARIRSAGRKNWPRSPGGTLLTGLPAIGLLNLLSIAPESRSSEVTPLTVLKALTHQSSMQKKKHTTACLQANLGEHFLNKVRFPNDSSMSN